MKKTMHARISVAATGKKKPLQAFQRPLHGKNDRCIVFRPPAIGAHDQKIVRYDLLVMK
jgi:hypothetical protein